MDQFKKIADSPWFNQLSMGMILLGAVVVGFETDTGLVAEHGATLKFLDRAVLWFFTLEVLIRWLACSPQYRRYLSDGWNLFDLGIVVACHALAGSPFLNVLRLLRVLRTLRMIRSIPRLRIIVEGLMKGLSSMTYVSILLGLVFYIFGVIGVFMFRDISPDNFGTLGQATFTLFQVVTLEGWVDILAPIEARHPLLGRAYFILFIVLGTMIFLNLFIGAIVGGMSEAEKESEQRGDQELAKELARLNHEVAEIRAILKLRQ